MANFQNALEYVTNKMQMGEITADQANVLIVQMMGVRLITTRLPIEVRRALNAAVKSGELGHIKKEGNKPEAYFHKNGRTRALEARYEHERNVKEAMKKVCGFNDHFLK